MAKDKVFLIPPPRLNYVRSVSFDGDINSDKIFSLHIHYVIIALYQREY